MSTPREQGMEALKEGNLDKAVELLARAVMADDNDVEAKALLGVVYSQKGLHTQAKRALMTAVEREPTNQNYRFNLGVVMERAGDAAGAAVAYRDLLQLNPQHPQARAKLQAMGPAAMNAQRPAGMPPPPGGAAPPPAAIPPPPVMGAPPGYGAPPGGAPPGYGAPPGGAPPGYGAPPMGAPPMGAPPGYGPPGGAPPSPMHGAPPMGAPPIGAPPIGAPPMGAPPMGASPGYGAPPGGAPPGYGAPSMGMGMGGSMPAPPGTVQCPSCGQFPKVGMLCEFCNSPLPPPPKHSAAPPPTYGPPPGVGGPRPGAVPHYGGGGGARMDDSFSVPDGFASWGRVIASPRAFFQEQAGFSGIQGPLGFLMAYSIVYLVISTIASAMRGVTWNGTQVIATVISVPCIWVMSAIVMFIWGGIVHMAAKIVGGQSDYSGSFRAGTYSNAPGMALNLLLALIAPMLMGTGGSPAGGARRSVSASPRPALVAPASAASITLAQTFPRGPGGPAGSPFGSPGSSTSPFGSSGQNPSQMLQTIMSRLLPLMLVGFVGWIWSAITLGIAISEIHQVSGGAAAGAVIISYIISIVIAVVIWIALASVILGIIAAAGSRISG